MTNSFARKMSTEETAALGKEVMALEVLAMAGDVDALSKIPGLVDHTYWRLFADRAEYARVAFLLDCTAVSRQRTHYQIEVMRADLSAPGDTPLVRMAIDHLLTTWLVLNVSATNLARSQPSASIANARFLQVCHDRAAARHLAALKTLDFLRRKPVPSLQINVASQQINVADGQTFPSN